MTKILVLAGATAVGKTALAIQWAQHFNGEIINADSRQVYRYMDIGTAKPTPVEQSAAVHHLLDVVNPDETLTLADFQSRAYARIEAIHERGKVPILAGGTGMYIT
ncbi:MAG TPA: isopentenyl transferase family protein, partial [Aggregatilineales bacterium]|nr:isopentenyl transferase family protein [Aggregatilineales bacterium]